MNMSLTMGEILRQLRGERSIIEISQHTGVDPALISKYERGKRTPSEVHVRRLQAHYGDQGVLLKQAYIKDRILEIIHNETDAQHILGMVMEDVAHYKTQSLNSGVTPSKKLKSLLQKADKLKNEWQGRRPIDPFHLRTIQKHIYLNYTYHSNQIEGNTLSIQETRLVIEEGLTIHGKSLQEHLEAINHHHAIDYLEDLVSNKRSFNKNLLLQIHRLVLYHISNEHAGVFRIVPVRITGSKHVPPQPYLIEKQIEEYFLFYEAERHRMHPIMFAAELQERLVSIHPFIDGNGRTSRLVMNLSLMQNGFTIANLHGDAGSRIRYYNALEACREGKSKEAFYTLIAETCIHSLEEHISLL